MPDSEKDIDAIGIVVGGSLIEPTVCKACGLLIWTPREHTVDACTATTYALRDGLTRADRAWNIYAALAMMSIIPGAKKLDFARTAEQAFEIVDAFLEERTKRSGGVQFPSFNTEPESK